MAKKDSKIYTDGIHTFYFTEDQEIPDNLIPAKIIYINGARLSFLAPIFII